MPIRYPWLDIQEILSGLNHRRLRGHTAIMLQAVAASKQSVKTIRQNNPTKLTKAHRPVPTSFSCGTTDAKFSRSLNRVGSEIEFLTQENSRTETRGIVSPGVWFVFPFCILPEL
ncbi:MAG: hypothetical protein ACPGLY_25750 [Rubripirellula sp.]